MPEQSLRDALLAWLRTQGGEVHETGDGLVFTKVLAERRAFLASRRTTLHLRLKIYAEEKELVARLSLVEKGAGLAVESGVGRSSEVFKVGRRRSGKVQEDLKFLFERYRLSF
ncbi:hypothetical protein H5T57_04745, partial [Candidatus Bipolaricaulota bacterium]|nr:hypothetical protein [Candidatus Bipolaricaulota bacterium]